MKRSVVRQRLLQLFFTAVSLGLPSVHAHAKKTFLMPRAVGMNKAMEFTPWQACLHKMEEKRDCCMHNRVQAIPFYQHSTNKADVGEYFGIGNCSNKFTVGARYDYQVQGRPLSSDLVENPAEVDGALMSGFEDTFEAQNAPHQFNGTVHFRPDQEIWGVRIDWEYFEAAQKGFFFNVAMPFASVSNSMNMCVENDKAVHIAEADAPGFPGPEFTLVDFFAGKVKIDAATDPADRRDPLTKSKIACRNTEGGLADLDLTLGYRHNWDAKKHVAANVRLTVPTGNRVHGCHLFEAVCGNGHHVGLGFGLDGGIQAWHNDCCKIWIEAGAQFKYLFKNQEVRMLGVKGYEELPPLAHYMLMSTVHGAVADGVALFPAANQLTRELDVTPGSHIDALIDVSLHMKKFVFDIGYNLYWRDEEKVEVRTWEENTYGILANTVDTSAAVSVDDFLDQKFVNCENLDTCAAQTPRQLTHKIHAGVSYRPMWRCCPMQFGVGGSYEFASNNSALEQYAIWLKGSIAW